MGSEMCIRDSLYIVYVVAVAHNLYVKNLRTKCKIVSSSAWKSERFPRFTAPFSTRGDPFRLLFPLPCPPASTSPGEGLPGGLLEASCGRRKRRSARNRLNVGTFIPLQNMKRISDGGVGKNFNRACDNRQQYEYGMCYI